MSVTFSKITFKNDNGISLNSLTVDVTPGGRVYGPNAVAANTSILITPDAVDVVSTTFTVESDGDPGVPETQTFSATNGAYIAAIDVVYTIGNFDGTVTSSDGEPK